jgi:putative phosphoesterase
MILGILSDTHGRVAAAREGLKILRARGAEYFIHCGDVGDGVLALLPAERCAFVFGNNDFDKHGFRDEAAIYSIRCLECFGDLELDGKRIAVTHGDDARILREIRAAERFDYLLTGHTHMAHDQREGSLRCINPGALHRAHKKTVATLDLKTDLLTFHEVEGV